MSLLKHHFWELFDLCKQRNAGEDEDDLSASDNEGEVAVFVINSTFTMMTCHLRTSNKSVE